VPFAVQLFRLAMTLFFAAFVFVVLQVFFTFASLA
jgi:hypothetical protein